MKRRLVLRGVLETRIRHPPLRTGTTSVREVAARVGFADPAAFSRAFKRWTGRSLSQVQREGWAASAVAVAQNFK